MTGQKLTIQSGTEKYEVKLEELFCWDCKKKIGNKTKFVHYEREGINYFKCDKCHAIEPQLHFQECEVYSRIVGYIRPVKQWNPGKKEEWNDRKMYEVN